MRNVGMQGSIWETSRLAENMLEEQNCYVPSYSDDGPGSESSPESRASIVPLAVLRNFMDDLAAIEEWKCPDAEITLDKMALAHKMACIDASKQNEMVNQKTIAHIKRLTYVWQIQQFSCIRDHAALSALPHLQNFIESDEFGNDLVGKFYLMLFPYGENGKDSSGVVVKVVSNNKQSTTARASFVVFTSSGEEILWTRRSFDSFKWFQTALYYNSILLFTESELKKLYDETGERDCFRIKCVLDVCTSISDESKDRFESRERQIVESAPMNLLKFSTMIYRDPSMRRLLDVRILLDDGTEIIANSFVLAARSPVFHRMLTEEFSERRCGEILVQDCLQKTMRNFLDFQHTDTCELLEMKKPCIEELTDILILADRFDTECLRLHSLNALALRIDTKNALNIYGLAKRLNLRDLEKLCVTYVHQSRRPILASNDYFLDVVIDQA